MSTIEIRKLTKVFGDFTAVKDADLSVAAGEVVCLLGPSGCGKTTTLRMIAGLERATAGDVIIAGQRMNDLTPEKRNIAMVFQFYALYPALTVGGNIAMPLHYEGIGSAEIAARVNKVADILHLTEVLDRLPGQVSEGEKQRIAVARAIVRDPNCFLFDEPLSRLDVELRHSMRGQIKGVLSNLSKATVIVTHDQLEALTMADRIAVMRDGLIEQCASPHEIFARPANRFVAGFIGTPQMNLIPAVLDGSADCGVRGADAEGMMRFRIDSESIVLRVDPAVGRLPPDSSVTLGIRPRSVELVGEPQPDSLSADVDLVEPMGAETLLHVVGPGRELRIVVDQHVAAHVGERLHLRFKPGQTHVFGSDERRVSA
jgi:multiple sugar transport system ATP-binding protein